ncbi:MAG: DUF1073 domain-containing protein [Chloroflexi bacterium]|nr:DUF1073 domain-containing protein [Chloroflexota bacterium]
MPAKKKNTIEVDVNTMRKILYGNATSSLPGGRLALLQKSGTHNQFSGARNIREVAGYPETLTFEDYLTAYDRQDVATRVIETYPDYTWITPPEVYENEKPSDTAFEKDWKAFISNGKVISTLRSFDVLSGIGEYGVLVIGIDDGKDLSEPLEEGGKHKIVYMRPYTEGECRITEWDEDKFSERYTLPEMYEIKPNEFTRRTTSIPMNQGTLKVHYSRVIHFADNALNSEVFGVPRLKRVYDRLMDILKIVAGSGEMFWRGAYQGFSFEADTDAELSADDKTAMKQEIQQYLMGLDRSMLLQGVKTNPIAPAVASPKEHLDAQLTMVAIASRIPKRILSGSEMGKLASTQDAENWAQQITTRRTNTAEPKLLRPFVDFCIKYGIISAPKASYKVIWPSLAIPSDKDISESALNFTNALSTYAGNSLYTVMPFRDYLINVWRYSIELAEQMSNGFDEAKFKKLKQELTEKKGIQTPKDGKNETPDT